MRVGETPYARRSSRRLSHARAGGTLSTALTRTPTSEADGRHARGMDVPYHDAGAPDGIPPVTTPRTRHVLGLVEAAASPPADLGHGLWDVLDPVTDSLAGRLTRAARELQARLNDDLAFHEVTFPQWMVLHEAARSVPTTPGEVADSIGMARSTISPVVRVLVDRGLLTRSEAYADARACLIRVTHRGARVVRAGLACRERVERAAGFAPGSAAARALLEDLRALEDGLAQSRRTRPSRIPPVTPPPGVYPPVSESGSGDDMR